MKIWKIFWKLSPFYVLNFLIFWYFFGFFIFIWENSKKFNNIFQNFIFSKFQNFRNFQFRWVRKYRNIENLKYILLPSIMLREEYLLTNFRVHPSIMGMCWRIQINNLGFDPLTLAILIHVVSCLWALVPAPDRPCVRRDDKFQLLEY